MRLIFVAKPIRVLFIILLSSTALHLALVEAALGEQQGHSTYVNSVSKELVVGVSGMLSKSYARLMDLISKYGGKVINDVFFKDKHEAVVVKIPQFSERSFVEEARVSVAPDYIEPNIEFKTDFVPSDPYWTLQWGPRKISADYAWNTTLGSSSVLIAVIDTGVDWTHPDLAANYVPLGYDWVNHDSYPMDDNGHGTHVAGIIGAVMNNGIGIAGVSQVRIMAEKGLNQSGYGSGADLANAIVHAVDQGAKIISMSWGDYEDSSLIQHAIMYAYDSEVLLVAAAGNDATSVNVYPASYEQVIAVSATDQYDNKAWFSNYGDWIELAAPGTTVFSTLLNHSYGYMSGTSMATPFVSSVAALIWSRFPGITRDQVRTQLRNSTDDLGAPGFDIYYGYGRVNASRAVKSLTAMRNIAIINVSTSKNIVGQGFNVKINATADNQGSITENFSVFLYVNSTVIHAQVLVLSAGNLTNVSFAWNTSGYARGKYVLLAYASPVPNETSTVDNTFTYGTVFVVIVGDITGAYGLPDGKVDMRDIGAVAIAFGSHLYYQNWNPNADINGDGKVDIRDVGIVAKNFGKIGS